MALYRIHSRLIVRAQDNICVDAGCTHTLSMLGKDKIGILLKSGNISEVQAPPLDTFTGWAGRAKKLAELGIDTIGFVSMDAADVAYAIRASVRREEEDQETFDRKVDRLAQAVARWQAEIEEYLGIGSAETRR